MDNQDLQSTHFLKDELVQPYLRDIAPRSTSESPGKTIALHV
jgi:hypothetical protein